MARRIVSRTVVLLGFLCAGAGCKEQEAHAAVAAPSAQVAQRAPLATEATPAAVLGKSAPDFTLNDSDGVAHTLSQLRGKTVVLEWFNPDCPFARFAHEKGPLKDMAGRVARENLVWLSINSGGPGKQGHGLERNKQAKTEYSIKNPILLDESGRVGHAYGAQKTPHLFVIDAKGLLVYRGGIDNAPMGVVDPARPRTDGIAAGKLVNYVDAALDDLSKGRSIRLPETPAYGCSVKYQS
jgi:hypothetical protein